MLRLTGLLAVFCLCSAPLLPQTPGNIQTIAGAGAPAFSGDGGPAIAASLNVAVDVSADGNGNLFIADQYNHRIREITPDGTITTIAGTGAPGFSGDGGPATAAQLNTPTGVHADGAGNIYIGDVANQRIRKIDPSGIITTVAGNGVKGYGGDGGPATSASLYNGARITIDPSGNLLIADQSNHRIRSVSPDGTISTLAGNGAGTPATGAFSGDGGPATNASLNNPTAIAVDSSGVVYFADQFNQRLRKITPDGVITTIAGSGAPGFSGDGQSAIAASLNYPGGLAVDSAGNVYVNDDLNYRTRRIDTNGVITTVAGSGAIAFSGDGGPATSASLNGNFGITIDTLGNLYIADSLNNRIREVYGIAAAATMSAGPSPR
jgi:trimeric autotransporter adhesin